MRGDICSIYIYICFCFFLFIAHAGLLSREPADKSWGHAQKYLAESPLNGPWISSVQIPWGNHLFTSVFSLRFCQPDFSTGNEIAEQLIRINKGVIQCNMWQVTTVTQNREIGVGTTDFMLLGSTWLAVEVDIGGWYPATTVRLKRYVYLYVSYLILLYQYINIYLYAQTGTFADPTVRCFKAFFDLCTFVRFFVGVSRRFFFLELRIKPTQGIRVKSVGWAHSTTTIGTSLTILFQSCEHRKNTGYIT